MTPRSPLIGAEALRALLASAAPPIVLDCSFDLADSSAGERSYGEGHLPHAQYLHLDRDLSGPKTGSNGRHPPPGRAQCAEWMGRLGIAPEREVVVCDRQAGMFAVRAWWVLRWMGHTRVALLDGGLAAWLQAGGSLTAQIDRVAPAAPYPAAPPAMPTLDAQQVLARLGTLRVIDARAPERYRGDVEPLDAVAGHIPGALNRFFKDNLQSDGRFKPAAQLRSEFETLWAEAPGTVVVNQCGSGVTACHNLLAMEVAGLGTTALYPGSWSEWSSDASRPMARR